MWHSISDAKKKQSPWFSASEKGIDSLTVQLIPTIAHSADFSFITLRTHTHTHVHSCGPSEKEG